MSVAVRPASLAEDRQEMLDLLTRNLPNRQEEGFKWRYMLNPAGQARSWFVHEQTSKLAVAMVSLFPRKMYVDGHSMVAGQVMHFVVDASHRSLGPAVLLQRATFEPVTSGALDFCYDCPPHDRGMSTFVRLGMRPNCELIRHTRLLRSDEYFETRFGKVAWTKPAVAMTNLFFRGRSANHHVPGLEICEFDGPFGEEFSALDAIVSSAGTIRRRRSAEDLNWLYRENPEREYRVLVARQGGELLAFAVFLVQTDALGCLVDLFGRELPKVGSSLLEAVVESCRRENLWAVHGRCSDGSELKSLFGATGFRPREMAARVVAYAKPDGQAHRLLGNGLRWSLSQIELLG
jgi:hypothetical protein